MVSDLSVHIYQIVESASIELVSGPVDNTDNENSRDKAEDGEDSSKIYSDDLLTATLTESFGVNLSNHLLSLSDHSIEVPSPPPDRHLNL